MRVLLIAPHFPPKNSPGATRMLTLSALLGERGVDVTVATFDGGYNFHDEVDVDARTTVIRVAPPHANSTQGILQRLGVDRFSGFCQVPDRGVRWNAAVRQRCVEEHRRQPFDAVMSSSNPYSASLLGADLSEELGVPFVAEFRDPWTQNPFLLWPSRLHYEIERRQHRRVCQRADQIVMNTEVARRQILEDFGLSAHKVHVVTNGFDPDDYTATTTRSADGRPLEFAHVGNFYSLGPPLERNWKGRLVDELNAFGTYARTSFDPLCRSPYYLFEAMSLRRRASIADGEMRFHQVGSVGASSDEFTRLVDHFGLTGLCHQTLRVTRMEAMSHERAADVVVLAQLKPGDGSDCPAVAAKTYGALATGKPILGLVPHGDMRRLLEESGRAVVAEPDDPPAIARALDVLIQRGGRPEEGEGGLDLSRFHWPVIADQLHTVLGAAVRARHG